MSEAVAETSAPVAAAAPEAAAAPPAAIETPAAAEGAPPAAAAAPEAPKEEPKVEPKEFIALKREKAKLLERDRAVKQREQQIEQAMAEIVAPVRSVLDAFDDTPDGLISFVAKAKGISEQDAFDKIVGALAKRGDPPDPNDRVTKLERQLAEKDAAEKKAREEREAAEVAKAEAAMRDDMSARLDVYLSGKAEEYDALNTRGDYYVKADRTVLRGDEAKRQVHNDLMDLAEVWHTTDHKHLEPTIDNVARVLEAQYLAEDEELLANRLLKSKKLAKHFAPAPTPAPATAPATPSATPPANAAPTAPPAVAPAAGNTAKRTLPVRTINSRQAAVPAGVARVFRKPQTDAEVRERAMALLPARYRDQG